MSYFSICQYSIARRERDVPPDTVYDPLIFPADLIAKTPYGGVAFFGWCGEPVNSLCEAQYVVYPNTMAPPPGFQWFCGAKPPASQGAWEANAALISELLYTPPAQQYHPAASPITAPATTPQPDKIKLEEQKPERQQLMVTPDGYFITSSKSNRKVRATNYLLDDVVLVHHIRQGKDGEINGSVIQLTVRVISSRITTENVTISIDELDTVGLKIGKKLGSAIIYPAAKGAFYNLFTIMVRERLDGCPQRYEYEVSGWMLLPQGKWVYVQDGANPPFANVTFKSGFRFGEADVRWATDRLISNAWRLLSLSEDQSAALIPFLFAHMALLWSLFDAAGYPPHVLLFIKGTTGSLKTAVASLLFNFNGEKERNIPATFRDTSASMEVKMGQYRDRVLLVDDFCPAASENARRVLEQNLEQLVRFYGDGIAKARTNPKLEEVYEKRPHGLCAITGEDSAGSYSSLLRCLFITVRPDTYDKDLLAQFQADPRLWTEYLSRFVEFCVDNAPQIIGLIQSDFPVYREKGGKAISERRLADAYACLAITARIMLDFACANTAISVDERDRLFAQFSIVVLDTCRASAEESKGADPVKIFARLLVEGIDRHAVVLPTRQEFEAAPDKFLGYVDGDYWYFWGSKLYDFIRREYAMGDRTFPLTQGKLWESLYVANVLVPGASREGSKGKFEYGVRASFGNRPRLIRIDPAVLSTFL